MFSTSFGLDSIFRFKKKREIYNPTLVVPVTSSLDEEGGKDSRERESERHKNGFHVCAVLISTFWTTSHANLQFMDRFGILAALDELLKRTVFLLEA